MMKKIYDGKQCIQLMGTIDSEAKTNMMEFNTVNCVLTIILSKYLRRLSQCFHCVCFPTVEVGGCSQLCAYPHEKKIFCLHQHEG